MSNAIKSNRPGDKRQREIMRRNGIKKIDARIKAGETHGGTGESLTSIRSRLVKYYEAEFGLYTGKSPR